MVIKQRVLLLLLSVLVTVPNVAIAESGIVPQEITAAFSGNSTSIQHASHSTGGTIVAYPNAHDTGVTLHHYDQTTATWVDAVTLDNDTIAAADRQTISELTVLPLSEQASERFDNEGKYGYGFVVYWISEYYLDDLFIVARYNVYYVTGFEKDNDPGVIRRVNMSTNDAITADSSVLAVMPGIYNYITVLWKQDGVLYSRSWDPSSKWIKPAIDLSAIATPTDFFTENVIYYELDFEFDAYVAMCQYVYSSATGDILGKQVGPHDNCPVNNKKLMTITEDVTLLDVSSDSEFLDSPDIFLLYQQGNKLYRQAVGLRGGLVDEPELVMSRLDENLRPNDVSVYFNVDDAEYVMVARVNAGNSKLQYAMKDGTTWQHQRKYFFTANAALAVPQIRPALGNTLALVWRGGSESVLYVKRYNRDQATWGVTKPLKLDSNVVLELVSPLTLDPVNRYYSNDYIEAFMDGTVQSLRSWDFTKTVTDQAVSLPNGFNRIAHQRAGKYHSIIIQNGSELKSIIAKEQDLFGKE